MLNSLFCWVFFFVFILFLSEIDDYVYLFFYNGSRLSLVGSKFQICVSFHLFYLKILMIFSQTLSRGLVWCDEHGEDWYPNAILCRLSMLSISSLDKFLAKKS